MTNLPPQNPCTIIRAPNPLPSPSPTQKPSIFLSGTTSTPWREDLISSLSSLPITILDPLRPDWDSRYFSPPPSPLLHSLPILQSRTPYRHSTNLPPHPRSNSIKSITNPQPSWHEDISYPPFHEQVTWELDAMDAASMIVVYLHPGTESPSTLLELGLWVREGGGKVVVWCPEGFLRRGNVQVVCARFGVEVMGGMEGVGGWVRGWVGGRGGGRGGDEGW